MVFQQRIDELERMGLNCSYDRHSLQNLQKLEQFLKMSWDVYMDSMESATIDTELAK
jgi:hypothetical protein